MTLILSLLIAFLTLLPALYEPTGVSLAPIEAGAYLTVLAFLTGVIWAMLELIKWGFWSCVRKGVAWTVGCVVVAGIAGVFVWGLLFW